MHQSVLLPFVWFCGKKASLLADTIVKDLPPDVREAQEKKFEELKKQQEIHTRLAVERKIFLRDRKIKFFGKFILELSSCLTA